MATSYCTVADIATKIGTPITASTKPTSTEAQSMADKRASVLSALCYRFGVNTSPDVIQAGDLKNILIEANTIGAALDYTLAQLFGLTPTQTDRIPTLASMWRQYTGLWDGISPSWIRGEGYIELLIKGTLAVSNITAGLDSETVDIPRVAYDDKL